MAFMCFRYHPFDSQGVMQAGGQALMSSEQSGHAAAAASDGAFFDASRYYQMHQAYENAAASQGKQSV